MEHCKTCEHYTHLDPNATNGTCKVINSNEYFRKLASIGAEEENLFLDVDEDFGCVLHEPRFTDEDVDRIKKTVADLIDGGAGIAPVRRISKEQAIEEYGLRPDFFESTEGGQSS
jgi:hypothetical protein